MRKEERKSMEKEVWTKNLCLNGSEESANILQRQTKHVFPITTSFFSKENHSILLQMCFWTPWLLKVKCPTQWIFVAPKWAVSNYLPSHVLSPSLELFEDNSCVLVPHVNRDPLHPTLLHLTSRHGAYFFTPWMWADCMTCSSQWKAAAVTSCKF